MRPIEKQIADRLKEIADLAYRINILCDDIEFNDLERANEDFIELKRKLEDVLEFKEMLIERTSNWHKFRH